MHAPPRNHVSENISDFERFIKTASFNLNTRWIQRKGNDTQTDFLPIIHLFTLYLPTYISKAFFV